VIQFGHGKVEKMFQSLMFRATAPLLMAGFISPYFASAEPVIIGSIHREAAAEIAKFLPLANYVGRQLQSEGVNEARIVVAKDVSQMVTLLRQGKVDIYIDSPYPAITASVHSGSKFLLRRWKRGQAEYHSIIFTKKDSNLHRLEDLKGKILAFEEPFSSSGYLIPKMALAQEGLKLVPNQDDTKPVNREEIRYRFSLDDESTVVWVLRGKVIAGATDDRTYQRETQRHPNTLKAIYTTSSFPRQLVSCRADLAPKLVTRIKQILIEMDQSPEGRSALKEFEETTKFDELPGPSIAQLLKTRKFIAADLRLR
jgi:phosphonate transport system substrate-binding protein